MNLMCTVGIHDWNGCECQKCGKIRDKGHDWTEDCQKCAKCGKTRDENHKWDGCRCTVCSKTRDEDHKWDGCRCTACDKTRDEGHHWDRCKCTACGKTRDKHGHDWSSDCQQCALCGAKRSQEHKWVKKRCSVCSKKLAEVRLSSLPPDTSTELSFIYMFLLEEIRTKHFSSYQELAYRLNLDIGKRHERRIFGHMLRSGGGETATKLAPKGWLVLCECLSRIAKFDINDGRPPLVCALLDEDTGDRDDVVMTVLECAGYKSNGLIDDSLAVTKYWKEHEPKYC